MKATKCDLKLKIPGKETHRGLFKFWLNDREFVYVCAACLGVLVRREWATRKSQLTTSSSQVHTSPNL